MMLVFVLTALVFLIKFFLTPSSSFGRGSTTTGRANWKRGLFGGCCALLGLPMALSQCHVGWVCPLLWQEFLQKQHPGAESDSASGLGGLKVSTWVVTVSHLDGTALCQVACRQVMALVWLFVCSLIQQTLTELQCTRPGFDLNVGLHVRWCELADFYGSRGNTSSSLCINIGVCGVDPQVQVLVLAPTVTSWVALNLKLLF